MSRDKAISRVQTGALVLMIGVGLELLRYVYTSFDRALNFCFWEPDRWNTHWMVDAGTMVETGPRIQYFAIWTTIILLSVAAFVVGLVLLNHVRRGHIFSHRSARAVHWLGLVLAVAMVADLIFHAIDPWLLTHANTERAPIRWGYDPSDLKTLSMAVILFLFGWVMRQSIEIERENRGFV